MKGREQATIAGGEVYVGDFGQLMLAPQPYGLTRRSPTSTAPGGRRGLIGSSYQAHMKQAAGASDAAAFADFDPLL